MMDLITLIEEFGETMGTYFAPLCAFVIVISVVVTFYSHKIAQSMNLIVGAFAGAIAGQLVTAVVLVNVEGMIIPGMISLGLAILMAFYAHRSPMVATATMAFLPPALVVGCVFTNLTGSMGVGVFLALVFGSVVAVVGAKIGRYFIIGINAVSGATATVIALLATLGILSKVYEVHTGFVFLPILFLAVAGASYQIIGNPERLAEVAAQKAAAEEALLAQFAVTPMWNCPSCKTNNRVGEPFCKDCGKTEKIPDAPPDLPNDVNPGWRCSCGVINNLSDGKCKTCGLTIGEATEWVCACGSRSGKTNSNCTACGQIRYQPYAKPYAPPAPAKPGSAAAEAN